MLKWNLLLLKFLPLNLSLFCFVFNLLGPYYMLLFYIIKYVKYQNKSMDTFLLPQNLSGEKKTNLKHALSVKFYECFEHEGNRTA